MLFAGLLAEIPYFGEVFEVSAAGCEIDWKNGAKKLPDTVPEFAAKDHHFTQKTIEYFKTLGGFREKDRVPAAGNLPSRKDSRDYATETRRLSISPLTGCLLYSFSQDDVDLTLAEAPTVEEAKELLKKLLADLDIELALLDFNHVRYTSGTHTRFDRSAGKAVMRRTDSGVFVPRLYAGQPASKAGIEATYGLNNELIGFSICWRDVRVSGQREIPSRAEIARLIVAGQATAFMQNPIRPNRILIDRTLIQYDEAANFRVATTVTPILFLSGIAEVDETKENFSMYLALPKKAEE